jgi:hypothetical protein
MIRFTEIADDLIKAIGHKYVRRIPKGTTKTGKTKYVYFYAGQENRGQGIGHESELVQGASFAMGQGDQRHHAHISKVDGDKITVKYDDGAKKGTEETMTKKQFQALVHGEHATGIKQAQAKAEKQLKDFQAGKEKGTKVKQSTLDKLEQRVKNLDELTAKKEETQKPDAPITKIQSAFKQLFNDTKKIKHEDNGGAIGMDGFLKVAKDFMHEKKDSLFEKKPIDITDEMINNSMNPSIFHEIMNTDTWFEELEQQNKNIIRTQENKIRSKYGELGKSRLQSGFYKTIYDKVFTPSFQNQVLKEILNKVAQEKPMKNLDLHIWKMLRLDLQKAFDEEMAKLSN